MDSAQFVDDVCLRFEDAWKRARNIGEAPRIETFLGGTAEPRRSELLYELVALDIDYRRLLGENPKALAYLNRFPHIDPDRLERLVTAPRGAAKEKKHPAEECPSTLVPPSESATPGNAPDPCDESSMPPRLGRYRLTDKLGAGTFGVVYRAYDEELCREVAIKLPHRRRMAGAQQVEAYLKEARVLASLDHPNIVPVFDLGRADNGLCFVVAKFIEGRDLSRQLKEARPPLVKAAALVAAVADALHYAHKRDLVHRDVKPANILINDAGTPLLADFGLALKEEDFGKDAGICGTPAYMSPEQASGGGHKLDGRSDIFSLGVVLYELLTGRRPFRGDLSEVCRQIMEEEPRPPRQIDDTIPKDLERICLKALAKRMSDRFTTAKDMAEDLRRFLKHEVKVDASTRSAPVSTGHMDWNPEAPDTDSAQTVPPQEAPPRASTPKPVSHPPHPSGSGSFKALPAKNASEDMALQIVLLYKRHAQADEQLLKWLEQELATRGHRVFFDRHIPKFIDWLRELEQHVRGADAVVVLLSPEAARSEWLPEEVRIAVDELHKQGKPRLMPVRINYEGRLSEELGRLLDPVQYFLWKGTPDNQALLEELLRALQAPPAIRKVAPPTGVVPLESKSYILRPTDQQFEAAIARQDSVILIRGARQVGKTSLLARGLHQARLAGIRYVITDFQKLNASDLESIDQLYRTLGRWIADDLDLDVAPEDVWDAKRGSSVNFERFIRRQVLNKLSTPLIWAMDEVDRLFPCRFGSEVFGLFRSWHNARVLDSSLPWSRLTLAIAYATEAHLFISDMNQSPFNIGTLLTLEDFTLPQVTDLNRCYGSPLRRDADLAAFYDLLGGQPYLSNRGLYEIVQQGLTIDKFLEQADRDDGIFGDHVRRILVLLSRDREMRDTVRQLLQGGPCTSPEIFFRLRSGGIVAGDSGRDVDFRCRLYVNHLKRHLL
jgi:serine/threonine protein kinase